MSDRLSRWNEPLRRWLPPVVAFVVAFAVTAGTSGGDPGRVIARGSAADPATRTAAGRGTPQCRAATRSASSRSPSAVAGSGSSGGGSAGDGVVAAAQRAAYPARPVAAGRNPAG